MNHPASNAPEGTGGHHVFQLYGQNDSYAPPITELTYALAARLDVAPTDPKVTTPDFAGVFPTPAAGAITKNANGHTLTAVVRQYAKPTDYDGHFVAYHNPLAQHDLYRFLDEVAKGMAPTVGP